MLNPKTGEVQCPYCRKRWIVPALIQKSETEKYLEEQSKQPRVIVDNTTETDKQLMNMLSGLVGFPNAVGNAVRRIATAAIGCLFVVIIIILAIVFIPQLLSN